MVTREFIYGWNVDHVVGQIGEAVVCLADDGNYRAAAGFDFCQVSHHFVVYKTVGHHDHAGRALVDQRDRAFASHEGCPDPMIETTVVTRWDRRQLRASEKFSVRNVRKRARNIDVSR